MKVKTSELIGPALDWAVASAAKKLPISHSASSRHWWSPSTCWNHGGPIIESERIVLDYYDHICDGEDQVHARLCRARLKPGGQTCWYAPRRGQTALVAAMRCYVASKFGDEIDVPILP